MSLIGVAVGLTLLGVVTLAAASLGVSGARTFRTGSVRTDLDARGSRALQRISQELRAAGAQSLVGFPQTPLFDEGITFDVVRGITRADGTLDWMPCRIQFEYFDGELDDGVDNNGNGLVDEGQVVLVHEWNTGDDRRVVLCTGVREYLEGESLDAADENGNQLVDERGLCFEMDGRRLTVRLTLEKLDPDGRLAMRTFTTSLRIRN